MYMAYPSITVLKHFDMIRLRIMIMCDIMHFYLKEEACTSPYYPFPSGIADLAKQYNYVHIKFDLISCLVFEKLQTN